jgi:hypothetical protein
MLRLEETLMYTACFALFAVTMVCCSSIPNPDLLADGPEGPPGENQHVDAFGPGVARVLGSSINARKRKRGTGRMLAKLFRTGLVTRRVPTKGLMVYPRSILLSLVQRSARTIYLCTTGCRGRLETALATGYAKMVVSFVW